MQLHYQVLMCNDLVFDQKCKIVLKKRNKKTQVTPERPVINCWDGAYGLTLSLVTLTGLCCYVHPKNS